MTLSRTNKNRMLIAANLLLFLIVCIKLTGDPDQVGTAMTLWVVLAPWVLLAVALTPHKARIAKVVHSGLFLTTGAAIGLTFGAFLSGNESLSPGEIFWLPIGIAAAVIHYWPSINDPYTNG